MKLNNKQKEKICDYIEQSLYNAKLDHILLDDGSGDKLLLIEFLSMRGNDITDGQNEIANIVQQIYYDMDTWEDI